jgi:hypothetical protein
MSLKAFHLLFISLSIALAIIFGLWALEAYRAAGDGVGYLATALVSLASAGGLVWYEVIFLRKVRKFES